MELVKRRSLTKVNERCILAGYELNERGSIPERRKKGSPSAAVSRPALDLTQLPVQWASWLLLPW